MDEETLEKLESLEAKIAKLEKQIDETWEVLDKTTEAFSIFAKTTSNSIDLLGPEVTSISKKVDALYKTVKGY